MALTISSSRVLQVCMLAKTWTGTLAGVQVVSRLGLGCFWTRARRVTLAGLVASPRSLLGDAKKLGQCENL